MAKSVPQVPAYAMESVDDSALPAPTAANAFRVLVVDDHAVIRRGLDLLIRDEEAFRVCGEAQDAPEACAQVLTLKPDFVITDISLAGMSGLDLVRALRAQDPSLLIVVLSVHEDSIYALRALRGGANAYVTKRDAGAHVLTALRAVTAGEVYVSPQFRAGLSFRAWQMVEGEEFPPAEKLTAREREVLKCLGLGMSSREIADTLEVSVKTVETHRAHIKEKLDFSSNVDMVRFAMECLVQG